MREIRDPDRSAREPAPIVCTLTDDAMPARLEEWRTLLACATARALVPGGIRITFGDDVPVDEVARLALAEHACCAFFAFTIAVVEDGIVLEVTAPPAAASLVTDLFGPGGLSEGRT